MLYYIEIFQLLYPAVDQLLVAESKLQLAVTHVVSALNSSIASLEEILQILDKSKGINTKISILYIQTKSRHNLTVNVRSEGSDVRVISKCQLSLLPAGLHARLPGEVMWPFISSKLTSSLPAPS